ncbi:hypothetical protein Hypma_013611 [Hypsizygus marmoreus]|uniref:DUF6534 domain-containing protein n=1 Tax=Hypsizygus marmoreus TaxID=39966 RepID=A0A369JB53_HYPMA|nr:hypothetical protein Hypma_013611 [Hypsizygus marmoreus]
MTVPPTLDNTWGVALLGLVASSIIYGITTFQLYIYFTHYPNDTRKLKLLAWSVWIIDSVSLGLVCNAVYGYLIRDIANPLNRLVVNRTLDVDPILMGLLSFLTHSYLGHRVWKVCQRNFWFGCLLLGLILASLSIAIASSVLSFRFDLWEERTKLKWVGLAGTILVVVLDIIIATVLCVYLLLQNIEGKRTKKVVNRILIFAVNTGLVSSIMSITNIVTYFALPNTLIFLSSNFIFTKVYANALLANLNARESLRGRGYTKDGTLTLNWSALRTNYNDLLVLHEGESKLTERSISIELTRPAAVNMSGPNRTDETLDRTHQVHLKV